MKKVVKLFLSIIILFVIFLVIYLSPRDYSLEYKLNEIKVKESYNKEEKYYKLSFNYKNEIYDTILFSNYSKNRKLIDSIEIIKLGGYTCLVAESNEIMTYPLCKSNNENISYHLVDGLKAQIDLKFYKALESNASNYKNIEINTLNDRTYLIWNYTGLDIISKAGNRTIDILKKDVYEIPLAYLLNDYFIIPDYESSYRFNKIYLYDIVKNKLSSWDLDRFIYHDSYILGDSDESLFIFDRKEKIELELVPHKKKMRAISPKILTEGEWEKVNSQKLVNSNITFSKNEIINYEIINNKLYKVYDNYKELISNKNVKYIVHYNNNEVYYLVDDTLYLYSVDYGEVEIMTYFEWNFNYNNKIFVY